jgi:hypothetical protein
MNVNAELTPIDGTGPDATNWREVMDKYASESDPRDTFSQSGYLSARFFVDAMLKLDPTKIDRATVTAAIRAIKNEKSDLLVRSLLCRQRRPAHAEPCEYHDADRRRMASSRSASAPMSTAPISIRSALRKKSSGSPQN